jgi:exodeoxyribonuclease VII small subunit
MAKQQPEQQEAQPDQEQQDQQLPGFEASLEQIQQIIDGIESGQISLEQSLEKYARGMKLIQHCRGILDRAESRIEQLTVDERGNLVESESGPSPDDGAGGARESGPDES